MDTTFRFQQLQQICLLADNHFFYHKFESEEKYTAFQQTLNFPLGFKLWVVIVQQQNPNFATDCSKSIVIMIAKQLEALHPQAGSFQDAVKEALQCNDNKEDDDDDA